MGDRFVGTKDALRLASLPGRAPAPKVRGEPDFIAGRLNTDRESIVSKMLAGSGIVCDVCAGPRRSELVEPVRVEVMASEMPTVSQYTAKVSIFRCAICQRIWDPVGRRWTEQPVPIEERK